MVRISFGTASQIINQELFAEVCVVYLTSGPLILSEIGGLPSVEAVGHPDGSLLPYTRDDERRYIPVNMKRDATRLKARQFVR